MHDSLLDIEVGKDFTSMAHRFGLLYQSVPWQETGHTQNKSFVENFRKRSLTRMWAACKEPNVGCRAHWAVTPGKGRDFAGTQRELWGVGPEEAMAPGGGTH